MSGSFAKGDDVGGKSFVITIEPKTLNAYLKSESSMSVEFNYEVDFGTGKQSGVTIPIKIETRESCSMNKLNKLMCKSGESEKDGKCVEDAVTVTETAVSCKEKELSFNTKTGKCCGKDEEFDGEVCKACGTKKLNIETGKCVENLN